MSEHPIQGLMNTAMTNIKEMVDVNTIIGDAITTPDGTVIIPVSKVSFGFGTGGSDYPNQGQGNQPAFGGGSGAGITINPIAFLVAGSGGIRLMQIADNGSPINKVLDTVPTLIEKVIDKFKKGGCPEDCME